MHKISANQAFLPVFSLRGVFGQDCCLCLARSDAAVVCPACECSLHRAGPLPSAPKWAYESATAAFAYRFPLDQLVQRFKYAGDFAVGRWLASQLADRAANLSRPDLLLAPPLSPSRLRERGFNQAHELARAVGSRLEIAVHHRGLARVRETHPQPGLGREARLFNLAGVFKVDVDLGGRHVAVVDDVLTTGATAQSFSQALKAAGAGRVDVWVVAHTPAPGTLPG